LLRSSALSRIAICNAVIPAKAGNPVITTVHENPGHTEYWVIRFRGWRRQCAVAVKMWFSAHL